MKKLLFAIMFTTIAILSVSQRSECYIYFLFNNADNIVSGTLNPARVSPSTFTLKGNDWDLSATTSSVAQFDLFVSTAETKFDALTVDTATLKSRIDFVAVDTGTLLSRVDYIAVDTATLKSRIDQVGLDTGTFKADYVVFKSTAEGFIDDEIVFRTTAQTLIDSAVGSAVTTGSVIFGMIITTDTNNTNDIVVTCNALNVMDKFYVNVATRVQMDLTGAGGASSDDASSWYDLYAISNGSTVSVYALKVGESFALPSGYTKWRKIGNIRNDGSSNVVPFYKKGNVVQYFTDTIILNAGTPDNNWTTIDLSILLPEDYLSVRIHGKCIDSTEGKAKVGVRVRMQGQFLVTFGAPGDNFEYGFWKPGDTGTISFQFETELYSSGSRNLEYQDGSEAVSNGTYLSLQGYTEEIY